MWAPRAATCAPSISTGIKGTPAARAVSISRRTAGGGDRLGPIRAGRTSEPATISRGSRISAPGELSESSRNTCAPVWCANWSIRKDTAPARSPGRNSRLPAYLTLGRSRLYSGSPAATTVRQRRSRALAVCAPRASRARSTPWARNSTSCDSTPPRAHTEASGPCPVAQAAPCPGIDVGRTASERRPHLVRSTARSARTYRGHFAQISSATVTALRSSTEGGIVAGWSWSGCPVSSSSNAIPVHVAISRSRAVVGDEPAVGDRLAGFGVNHIDEQ